MNRRRFLLGFIALPLLTSARPAEGAARGRCAAGTRRLRPGDHPEPREGVNASLVLETEDLENPEAAGMYDGIREIPHVADGIRCHCDCADAPGYYSLLTCYEGGGMAQWCEICQGEASIAIQLNAEGLSLNQIRGAIDRKFG